MTDDQLANIIAVISVTVGMIVALIIGYVSGYKDAKRHMAKDKHDSRVPFQ